MEAKNSLVFRLYPQNAFQANKDDRVQSNLGGDFHWLGLPLF
jgi:hypothetical protein